MISNRFNKAFFLVRQSFKMLFKHPGLMLYMIIPALLKALYNIFLIPLYSTVPIITKLHYLIFGIISTLFLAALIYHVYNLLENDKTTLNLLIDRIRQVIAPLLLFSIFVAITQYINSKFGFFLFSNGYLPHFFLIRSLIPGIAFFISFYVMIFIVIEKKSLISSFASSFKLLKKTFLDAVIGIFCIWFVIGIIRRIIFFIQLITTSSSTNSTFLINPIFAGLGTAGFIFTVLLYHSYKSGQKISV